MKISSVYTSVPRFMIICNTVPEIFLLLGYFLHFYPSNNSKNQNFKKMKKRPGDIIIFHMCTKNYDKMMYGSSDMVRDGQTDGRTE